MRAYELNLKNGKNDITVGLRITVGAQLEMRKKYKEEPVSSILSSVSDAQKMIDIFTTALNYKNNENTVTNGEELYDLLVDNGYAGQTDFMKLLTSVALYSGLISEKQKAKIDHFAEEQTDEAFSNFDTDEEDEKNQKTLVK